MRNAPRSFRAGWSLAAATLLAVCAQVQSAQADLFLTFANTTQINIPSEGIANPYPSSINVSGVTGQTINIQVGLFGLSHTYPNDLAAVVVSPRGTAVMLFSGPGGNIRAINLDLVFDDNAAEQIPMDGPLFSGTFRPGMEEFDDIFPDPGPGGKPDDNSPPPWQFEFAPWLNEDLNGRWDLFVIDAQAQDRGSISRGWAMMFQIVPEPTAAVGVGLLLSLALVRRRRIVIEA